MKGVLKRCRLTTFERKVLAATAKIPIGETRSYQWIAQKIGRPKAARAVGQALKKNPFPLIIPCHRVIHEDGRWGGYAGGGPREKRKLLELEKQIRQFLV